MENSIAFNCGCKLPKDYTFVSEQKTEAKLVDCFEKLVSGEYMAESIDDLLHKQTDVRLGVYRNLQSRVERGVGNVYIVGYANCPDNVNKIEQAHAKVEDYSRSNLWNLNVRVFLWTLKGGKLEIITLVKHPETKLRPLLRNSQNADFSRSYVSA